MRASGSDRVDVESLVWERTSVNTAALSLDLRHFEVSWPPQHTNSPFLRPHTSTSKQALHYKLNVLSLQTNIDPEHLSRYDSIRAVNKRSVQ